MVITAEMIMTVITAIVTYIFGILSKKFNWIESKYIPIQNAIIGLIAGIICYFLNISESDILTTIICCIVGAMASGGTYDLTKTSEG
jgi:hypothetical protein